MYKERINFLGRIDRALNSYEWYFRTRFHGLGTLMKAKPYERGHLTFIPFSGDTPKAFSYTTVCKMMKDYSIPNSYEPVHEEQVLVLHLPRNAEDYIKTWGKSDYVVCKHTEGDVTKFFYLNAPKLLSYLEKALLAVDWEGKKIPRHIVHIEVLKMSGLLELGIAEMVDVYNRKTGYIKIEHNTSNIEPPECFRSGYCKTLNLWKDSPWTDAYWEKFELRKWDVTGQSAAKEVTILLTETGEEVTFSSLTKAAEELSRLGKSVTVAQLSNCLKGRAKSFKTARGKGVVAYAHSS